MANFLSKVTKFANTKQGKEALDKAKAMASDPKNKEKLGDLVDKVKSHAPGAKKDQAGTPATPATPAAASTSPDAPTAGAPDTDAAPPTTPPAASAP